MKRSVAPAALFFALSVVSAQAYEPSTPPSPVDPGAPATHSVKQDAESAGENVFIGHFGEIVRLPFFWEADAKMQGPMERVNFHFKTIGPSKMTSAPFSPAAKDYIPENFARLRLMQMLVIPKDVPGGFPSLKTLREAKDKELRATGNPYDLRQVGAYPWPPDTFWVSISTPYPLFQLYTQSDKNYFIVTSGASPYSIDRKDPILANSTADLCSSLSTYVYKFVSPPRANITISDFAFAMIPGAAICVIALAIGFFPKSRTWTGRLRLIGRTILGLTSISLIITAPALFISWRHGLDRTVNEGSLLICAALIMPWACRAISSGLNGRKPWRVFAWSAASNILPVAVGFMIMRDFHSGKAAIIGTEDIVMLNVILGALGFINGIALGLTHQETEEAPAHGQIS